MAIERDNLFASTIRRGPGGKMRLRAVWAVICVAGLLSICSLTASVASAESLCTDVWVGPSSGNWSTGANWSTGFEPGEGGVACIASGNTVEVTATGAGTGVLDDEGSLVIAGGSLTVSGLVEASTVKVLSLTGGGVLEGAGTVDVTGSFLAEHGTMEGSGQTVLLSGATGLVKGAGLTLAERKLYAEGSVLVEGAGSITGEDGGQLVNSGILTINAEGTGSGVLAGSKGAAPSLTNASTGTLRKTEGTGTTAVGVSFDNEGTVSVTSSGTLNFSGGGSSGREHKEMWSTSSTGAVISLAGGTYALGAESSLSGEGKIEVASGASVSGTTISGGEKIELKVAGALELTGTHPSLTGHYLRVTGKLTATANTKLALHETFIHGGEANMDEGAEITGKALLVEYSGSWISGAHGSIGCLEVFVFKESRMELGESSSMTSSYFFDEEKSEFVGKGTSTLRPQELYLFSSSITGEASFETNAFIWEPNGPISGPGTYGGTISGTGTIRSGEIYSGSDGLYVLKGYHLIQTGREGGIGNAGILEMSNGALLEIQGGEFWADSGATAPGEIKVGAGSTSPPKIISRGEFKKTGESPGTEAATEVSVSFENWGVVRNESKGKLVIDGTVVPSPERQYGPENPAEKEAHRRAGCGDPVDCVTGNFTETDTDLAVGGRGVGLDLTRYYNAQAAAAGTHGVFGYGWSSSFSDHLEVNATEHTATVVQADGSAVTFAEEGKSFKSPAWSEYMLNGSSEEGYALTTTNKTVYKFAGASGRLESVTDPNGNVTSLGYNEKGQLVTVTDPASRAIKLAYNGEGLVESATGPMGHVVKYAYESGNLVSVTMPGESSARWKFKYDGSHRPTSMINGLGGETKNTYNEANKVTSQTEPAGHTLKWEYEGYRTLVTNEATKAVTLYGYDSADQLTEVAHGYGSSAETRERFIYDEAGNTITKTDGNGHTTRYEYDGEGNRIKQTDPEGHETKWTYSARHEVTSETLPGGEKTTTEYDEHGNPIKVSRPAPEEKTQETKYEYNAVGEMTAMIDPLGREWKYEYDTYGDRTAEIDPEGDKRTWKYNEDSQETSTTSPRGNVEGAEASKYTTTIERDAQGRPVTVSEPGPIAGKPISRIRASISGATLEGQTLTAAPGIWEGAPSLSYSYQWERCNATGGSCAAVSGATGSTYALGSADVGHTVRVVVMATNSSGSALSTSAVTAAVSVVVMPRYASQIGSKGSGAGQIAYPYNVALDSHGDVWVTDGENNRVDEFAGTGTFVEAIGWGVSNGESKFEVCTSSCRAGIAGTGVGQFYFPTGVAVGGGDLYVSDFDNDRIEEFNEKSEYVRTFGEKGAGAAQLEGAASIAIGPSGTVWVGDSENNRVDEFSSTGTFIETIGWGVSNGESKFEVCTSGCRTGIKGSGAGQFDIPIGIAFYGGTMYVVDDLNDRVEEFNEKSEYVGSFGSKGKEAGQFEEATNIGVESSTGHLYVSDWGDSRVEEFASSGGFVGQFGAPGAGTGQFKGPQGIAITSAGDAYVVDENNNRVQEWKPVSAPVDVAAPSVSGEMIEGQTLTAGTGIWTASPAATYSYQWQRCTSAGTTCTGITGATSGTYTLGSADIGHELRLQVTAKNTAGSTKAFSHTTQTPVGTHTTKYVYNAEGQVESETNAEGHTTTTTYNTAGEPIKVSYPGGQTTETEYDGAGQVIAQTDGNKHSTKYVRNALEQVTEAIEPLGHKTKKTYDGAGNLATLTDPEGRVTTYSYNKESQPTKASYSEVGTHTVEYAYNADGQRESMVDGSGTTSYSYDQLGRLTETKDGHGDKVAYGYDLANETTSVTYPNGKIVKYGYDKAGRMSSLSDWLSHTISFSYNPDSQPATVTFPEASGESDHYSYTPSGQISEASFQKGTETLTSLSYARNNDEQLTRTAQTGLPGEAAIEDAYDQNERLTTAGTAGYEYDAANNPTKQGSASYSYNAADELESGGGNTYTFNEEGQRTKTTPTSGPATSYAYNQAGALTTVTRPEEGSTTKIEDGYTYNGDGLRVTETITGKTNYLTWTLATSLPELLSDGVNSYIYGPDGHAVEQITGPEGEEHATYLHHDQQGSTRLLTNEKGETTGTYTYGPYGETTGHTGTATTALGYDGQYTSSDTGLIYLRAREYDPAMAQFLSVDPLVWLSRAPYTYAGDNPLNFADPSGRAFQICVGGTVSLGFFSVELNVCYVNTPHGEGVAISGGASRGPGFGVNVHAGAGGSNAQTPEEYGGPFANTGGSAQAGFGGYAGAFFGPGGSCTPVVAGGTAGVSAGVGAEAGAGASYTEVIPF